MLSTKTHCTYCSTEIIDEELYAHDEVFCTDACYYAWCKPQKLILFPWEQKGKRWQCPVHGGRITVAVFNKKDKWFGEIRANDIEKDNPDSLGPFDSAGDAMRAIEQSLIEDDPTVLDTTYEDSTIAHETQTQFNKWRNYIGVVGTDRTDIFYKPTYEERNKTSDWHATKNGNISFYVSGVTAVVFRDRRNGGYSYSLRMGDKSEFGREPFQELSQAKSAALDGIPTFIRNNKGKTL